MIKCCCTCRHLKDHKCKPKGGRCDMYEPKDLKDMDPDEFQDMIDDDIEMFCCNCQFMIDFSCPVPWKGASIWSKQPGETEIPIFTYVDGKPVRLNPLPQNQDHV